MYPTLVFREHKSWEAAPERMRSQVCGIKMMFSFWGLWSLLLQENPSACILVVLQAPSLLHATASTTAGSQHASPATPLVPKTRVLQELLQEELDHLLGKCHGLPCAPQSSTKDRPELTGVRSIQPHRWAEDFYSGIYMLVFFFTDVKVSAHLNGVAWTVGNLKFPKLGRFLE